MSLSLRILWGASTWLLFWALILTPLMVLGWILVPLAVLLRAYEPTGEQCNQLGIIYYKYRFTWPWLDAIYGNWEDGCCAGWQYKIFGSIGRQIIYWSCARNPVNNLRIVPYLSCKIDPAQVRFVGSYGNCDGTGVTASVLHYDTGTPQWFFAWHGLYSNFYWQFKAFGVLKRVWVGWKVMPADIFGVSPYRQPGAGFALQFKTIKENI